MSCAYDGPNQLYKGRHEIVYRTQVKIYNLQTIVQCSRGSYAAGQDAALPSDPSGVASTIQTEARTAMKETC